jgi:hypothetical protein
MFDQSGQAGQVIAAAVRREFGEVAQLRLPV